MPRGNTSITRHRRPWKIENGQYPVAVTATAGTTHAWDTSSQVGWTRITSDGTTVTVKCIGKASSDPAPSDSDWNTQTAALTSTNFDCSEGGTIGFESNHDSPALIDDITLKSDTDANGSYETTELVETFTADGSGYMEDTLAHDAAGNMTFDGLYRYTYDAWNRLVKVSRAYRDSGGTLQTGSVVQENEYDGRSFRIIHRIKNSGVLDATYHDYYTPGWQNIETRNGSGQVTKQHVWGLTYIDELVQVAVNGEPVDDPDFDVEDPDHDFRGYYAMQDANFNVLGIVDDAGVLVERYEYTPYGERTVFTSPGANDPPAVPGGLYTPSHLAPRITIGGARQPYGICDVGHQGLKHEDGNGCLYQRMRAWSPLHGRFNQLDHLKYIDGMNRYVGYHVLHGGLDPLGLALDWSMSLYSAGVYIGAGASADISVSMQAEDCCHPVTGNVVPNGLKKASLSISSHVGMGIGGEHVIFGYGVDISWIFFGANFGGSVSWESPSCGAPVGELCYTGKLAVAVDNELTVGVGDAIKGAVRGKAEGAFNTKTCFNFSTMTGHAKLWWSGDVEVSGTFTYMGFNVTESLHEQPTKEVIIHQFTF